MSKPITELSNEFSSELDGKLSALNFLKTLRACDSQIFSGWRDYSSVFDEDILCSCEFVSSYCAKLISSAIADPKKKVAIVMTGCGTSGRIAFQTARRYNIILAAAGVRPVFHYLISGGDSALLLSDELPEDDPVEGASDLSSLVQEFGEDGTFLIGVTCGLSAPYVAGQLHYALEDQSATVGAAVMGFNPVSMARNAVIEKAEGKWTFRDIAQRLEVASQQATADERRFAMLNPVVGPEPIAGSSRMKGGSATAVLLDAVCLRSLLIAEKTSNFSLLQPSDTGGLGEYASIAQICLAYQNVHSETYCSSSQEDALPACMRQAAKSLRDGGRLFYVGAASAGCMAFIDASEMPDTYGSPFDQIRGFVEGGWGSRGVGNASGDISHVSSLHRISYDHFYTDIMPTLSEKDTVVVVAHADTLTKNTLSLAEEVQHKSPVILLGAVNRTCLSSAAQEILSSLLRLSVKSTIISLSQEMEGLFDYSLKLLLNAVSTYAQAAGRGAVYKGLMVTTGPANDKIYNRCVEIISHTTQVSLARAEVALLQAIHKVDVVDEALLNRPRSFHIAASILPAHMRHCAQTILPLSMLMATDQWTVERALEALRIEPRVSVLLDETVLKNASSSSQTLTGKKDQYAVLVDLGGTNIRIATATMVNSKFQMNTIYSKKIFGDKSEEAISALIREVYDHVLLQDGISSAEPPACIVMAQPGCVNVSDGTISGLANFPWARPFPLKTVLKDVSGCQKIIIMDDCDAALIGEVKSDSSPLLALPSSQKSATAVMLTVGTGIGTSLFSNNAIHTGSRGLIEGGHMILHPGGLACPCGQHGCLEMYSSGTAIALRGQNQSISCADTATGDVAVTAEDVVREAQRGNKMAVDLLHQAAKDLATGLVNICRLYDPHVIIIGGGVGGILFQDVKTEFQKLVWKLHNDVRDVDIALASCSESGISGCFAIAVETMRCTFEDFI